MPKGGDIQFKSPCLGRPRAAPCGRRANGSIGVPPELDALPGAGSSLVAATHQRSDVTASAMSSVLAHGCAASAMMKAICFANSSFEGILKGSPTPRLASSSPSDRTISFSYRTYNTPSCLQALGCRTAKLAEPFRSLFDRLRGIAGRAQIHFSDFGYLGHIGIIRPSGISRLSLYHFSEISRAEGLLPRTKNILVSAFYAIPKGTRDYACEKHRSAGLGLKVHQQRSAPADIS